MFKFKMYPSYNLNYFTTLLQGFTCMCIFYINIHKVTSKGKLHKFMRIILLYSHKNDTTL